MKVRKKSQLTGIIHEMEIPVTEEQLILWNNGGLIQNVMPALSENEREFLITGITKEEWDEMIRDVEEDDDDTYAPC